MPRQRSFTHPAVRSCTHGLPHNLAMCLEMNILCRWFTSRLLFCQSLRRLLQFTGRCDHRPYTRVRPYTN
jgi:hypothetical protein